MDDPRQRFEAKSLRAMAIATWAVCAGVYGVALILLPFLAALSTQGPVHHADIPEVSVLSSATTVPWQQSLQKKIYLLHCLICPLLAWLSLRFRSRLNGWSCLAAFVLFIPAIFAVYRGLFQAQPHALAFLAAGLVLAIPCCNWSWLTRVARFLASRLMFSSHENETKSFARSRRFLSIPRFLYARLLKVRSDQADFSSSPWWPRLASDSVQRLLFPLLLCALLVLFLMPWKVHQFADALNHEVHLSSYLIGPALSLLKPQAVPALDFESHYGVGHAYTFSFFLGTSFHETLCSYLWFLFAVLSFYLLSAYFVLADFFRSRPVAFLLTVLLLALSMEGLTYRCPSNWPIRFPFLFLFLGSAARPDWRGRSWAPAVLAGAFAGLSLFWQTDVGLLLVTTGLVFFTALSIRERTRWVRIPFFFASAAAAFVLLTAAAFGPRTISLLFYQRLAEPLLLYATGFGFIGMRWEAGWPYVYNVIAPVVTLATLGYALKQFHAADPAQQRQARYLFFFGTSGMLMLFKWVNRSIDPIWSMNAPAIVVVLFWWLRYAAAALGESLALQRGKSLADPAALRLRRRSAWTCAAGLLGLAMVASFFHDPTGVRGYSSSPLVRLKSFTSESPTLANQLIGKFRPLAPLPRLAGPVDPHDVALIHKRTGAADAVAVLAALDWAYLAEARRAPAFSWVPVYYTHSFSLLTRVEETVRNAECLFIERESFAQLQSTHPDLHQRIHAVLRADFVFTETGKALDLYCHKPNRVARR